MVQQLALLGGEGGLPFLLRQVLLDLLAGLELGAQVEVRQHVAGGRLGDAGLGGGAHDLDRGGLLADLPGQGLDLGLVDIGALLAVQRIHGLLGDGAIGQDVAEALAHAGVGLGLEQLLARAHGQQALQQVGAAVEAEQLGGLIQRDAGGAAAHHRQALQVGVLLLLGGEAAGHALADLGGVELHRRHALAQWCATGQGAAAQDALGDVDRLGVDLLLDLGQDLGAQLLPVGFLLAADLAHGLGLQVVLRLGEGVGVCLHDLGGLFGRQPHLGSVGTEAVVAHALGCGVDLLLGGDQAVHDPADLGRQLDRQALDGAVQAGHPGGEAGEDAAQFGGGRLALHEVGFPAARPGLVLLGGDAVVAGRADVGERMAKVGLDLRRSSGARGEVGQDLQVQVARLVQEGRQVGGFKQADQGPALGRGSAEGDGSALAGGQLAALVQRLPILGELDRGADVLDALLIQRQAIQLGADLLGQGGGLLQLGEVAAAGLDVGDQVAQAQAIGGQLLQAGVILDRGGGPGGGRCRGWAAGAGVLDQAGQGAATGAQGEGQQVAAADLLGGQLGGGGVGLEAELDAQGHHGVAEGQAAGGLGLLQLGGGLGQDRLAGRSCGVLGQLLVGGGLGSHAGGIAFSEGGVGLGVGLGLEPRPHGGKGLVGGLECRLGQDVGHGAVDADAPLLPELGRGQAGGVVGRLALVEAGGLGAEDAGHLHGAAAGGVGAVALGGQVLLDLGLDGRALLLGCVLGLLVRGGGDGLHGRQLGLGLAHVQRLGVQADLLGHGVGDRLLASEVEGQVGGLYRQRGAGAGGLVVGPGGLFQGAGPLRVDRLAGLEGRPADQLDGGGAGVHAGLADDLVPSLAVDVDLFRLAGGDGLEQGLGAGLVVLGGGALGGGCGQALHQGLSLQGGLDALHLAAGVALGGHLGDGAGQVEACAAGRADHASDAQAGPELSAGQGLGVDAGDDLVHGVRQLGDAFLGRFQAGLGQQAAGCSGEAGGGLLGHATGGQALDDLLDAGGAEGGGDDGLDAPGCQTIGPAVVLPGQDALAQGEGLDGDGGGGHAGELAATHQGLQASQGRQGAAGEHQRGVGRQAAHAADDIIPEAGVVGGAGPGNAVELPLGRVAVLAGQGLHQAQGAAAGLDEAGLEGAAVLGLVGFHLGGDIVHDAVGVILLHAAQQGQRGELVGQGAAVVGWPDDPAVGHELVVGRVGDELLDRGEAAQVVAADGGVLGGLLQPGRDQRRVAAEGGRVEALALGLLLDLVEVAVDEVGRHADPVAHLQDAGRAGGVLDQAQAGRGCQAVAHGAAAVDEREGVGRRVWCSGLWADGAAGGVDDGEGIGHVQRSFRIWSSKARSFSRRAAMTRWMRASVGSPPA